MKVDRFGFELIHSRNQLPSTGSELSHKDDSIRRAVCIAAYSSGAFRPFWWFCTAYGVGGPHCKVRNINNLYFGILIAKVRAETTP